MTAYDASAIQILEPIEASERFPWLRVEALAAQYQRPIAWIARGLEACRRAGVDEDYFVTRYLERRPIARLEEVDEAFVELLRESRK